MDKENKMRGKIVDGVYEKFEYDRNQLRFCPGWTLNLDELDGQEYNAVRLVTETKVYSISKIESDCYGFLRVMKGEKKWIIPMQYWKIESKRT